MCNSGFLRMFDALHINPGNHIREMQIYADAKSGFIQMEFTENKKINLKEQKRKKRKERSIFFIVLYASPLHRHPKIT